MPNPVITPRLIFTRPPVQVLWLKADALGLSDGTAVSSWTDSSGNGWHHTQATGSKQPIFHTNQQNGQPGVRFDGVNDIMAAANVVTPSVSYSMFAVMKFDSAFGGAGVWRNGDANGWGILKSNAAREVLHRSSADLVDGATTTNTEIWSAVRKSGVTKFWMNGAEQALTNNTAVPLVPSGTTFLGALSEALGFFMAGLIFEVIVYDGALPETARIGVENYLIAKYAPSSFEIADLFTDADNTVLQSHVTTTGGYAWVAAIAGLIILSNGATDLEVNANHSPLYYVNHTLSSADYTASVDVTAASPTGNDGVSLGIRYDGGTTLRNGYFVSFFSDLSEARLYRVVAGVATQLGNSLSTASVTSMSITALGTTISARVNGVLVDSVTDNLISAAGFVGIGPGFRGTRDMGHYTIDNLQVTV